MQAIQDAELIVTELVTNALLHAGPPVLLRVLPDSAAVRLEVVDPSRVTPVRVRSRLDGMTGRGLALVDALTRRRGVELLPNGKVVWCELFAGSQGQAESQVDTLDPAFDLDAFLDTWSDADDGWSSTDVQPVPQPGASGPSGAALHSSGGPLPEAASAPRAQDESDPVYTVNLGEIPTELMLDAKAHVDNLLREFTLADNGARSGSTAAIPAPLAELISTVVFGFADIRQQIRKQALAAARKHKVRTELTLTAPMSIIAAGQRYLAALDEVDAYARAARLLTLESPAHHQVFRRWYVESLSALLQAAATGQEPTGIQTFEERTMTELGTISNAKRTAERAMRLQSVTQALAGATTAEQVASIGVAEGVAALGASGGILFMPDADDQMVTGGAIGYGGAMLERLRAERRDSELPAATALRTGRAIWLESTAERDEQFPQLAAFEPSTVSLCAVPIMMGERILGSLRFSFSEPRLFDESERSFVMALAAQAAQAMDRAALYAGERLARNRAESLASRLAKLQELTGDLAAARDLARVSDIVVTHAADALSATWVSLSLVRDSELALVAYRSAFTVQIDPWMMSPLNADLPANEAVRTGRMVWVPSLEEFRRRYPDANVGEVEEMSFVCLPLIVEERSFGALAIGFAPEINAREPAQLRFTGSVADACAQAVDRITALAAAAEAQSRLTFLAEASVALASSLDYRTTLTTIARLIVPRLADSCVVCLIDGDEYEVVAVAHIDPELVDRIEQEHREFPMNPRARHGVPQVVRSGQSELFENIPREQVVTAPMSERVRQRLLDWNLVSTLTVPLTGPNGTIGAIQMYYSDSGRHYAPGDVPMIEDVARRAAVAVENAQAFEARGHGDADDEDPS